MDRRRLAGGGQRPVGQGARAYAADHSTPPRCAPDAILARGWRLPATAREGMTGFWRALRDQFDGQQRLAHFVMSAVWSLIVIMVAAVAARYLKRWTKRVLLRAHMQPNVVQ